MTTNIIAQKFQVTVGGSYLINSDPIIEQVGEISTLNFLSNGQFERIYYNATTRYEYIITPQPALDLGISQELFSIGRLSVSGALGLGYMQFSYERGFSSSTDLTELRRDTSANSPFIFNSISDCDSTVSSNVLEIDNSTTLSVLDLSLMLEPSYELIPDLLSVSLGVGLRTPIASAVSTTRLLQQMTTENDIVICSFESARVHDRTGNSLNNLKIQLSPAITYQPTYDIGIKVGVHYGLTQLFSYLDNSSNVISPNLNFRPIQVFASAVYNFGSKELDELEVSQ